MFKEVFDFGYRRSATQAIGWYVIFMAIGGVLSGVAGAIFGATTFANGAAVGGRFAVIFVILLSVLILWNRKKTIPYVFLALLGVMISLFLGVLGGLIPLAYLTTRATLSPSLSQDTTKTPVLES
jgi:hypothetical protein